MDLALNNGKAFIKGKLVKTNILIEKGKIKTISKKKQTAVNEIDCKGKIILPGAIDVHVHFRTPGAEYKEDWFSGSLAALHGGITTVMDMPNTQPATTTVKLLEAKRKLIEKETFCNFDCYMAATNTNLKEIAKAKIRGVKVYYGSTTGNILFNRKEKLVDLMKLAKKKGFIVVVHAEDEDEMKENIKKYRKNNSPLIHPKIRTEETEAKAIETVLEMQRKIGNKIHIAHISTEKGIALVKKAKKRKFGSKVTCEVTPHHLFLDSDSYKKLKNLVKCNPSIKSSKHKKALFNGLKNGAIDIVATDHAPHSLKEKKQSYWKAPAGIPGIETSVPLLLDAVAKKKISLKRMINAVSEKPAELFDWKKKGFIKKGFDADLIIVDTRKSFKVENKKLFTKAQYSTWNGQRLKGVIETTIVGGQVFG